MESKSSLTTVKKNYIVFSIFKSTAFIVPILFVFLTEHLNLSISDILLWAGAFNLLPFFVEVPFGYLGDRFGDKKIILVAIGMQFLSCLALLLFDGTLGYKIYLISIYLASALYSGAEKSMIHEYFENEKDFNQFMIDVTGLVYKYTTAFLVIGSILFMVNPKLPFIVQLVAFIVAAMSFMKIEDLRHIDNNKKEAKLTQAFEYVVKDYSFILIGLVFSIFSLGVTVNHKLIQMDIVGALKIWDNIPEYIILGFFYVIGNLASTYGVALSKKLNFSELIITNQIIVLSILSTVSFLLISTGNIIFILLGFILLNAFKALFRPVLYSKLINLIPFRNLKTTILSVFALFSAIFISVGQVLYSFLGDESNKLNFYLSITMVSAGVIYIALHTFLPKLKIKVHKSLLTQKESLIIRENDSLLFVQDFPSQFEEEEIAYYKSLSSIPICPIRDVRGNRIIQEYISGLTLDKVADDVKSIVIDTLRSINTIEFSSKYHSATYDCTDYLECSVELKEKISDDKYLAFIHGDLHPGNVISSKSIHLVDWDLSGIGWKWYDYLMLTFSPMIHLSLSDRFEILMAFLPDFTEHEIRELAESFTSFKFKQLGEFAQRDHGLLYVCDGFKKLNKDILDGVY